MTLAYSGCARLMAADRCSSAYGTMDDTLHVLHFSSNHENCTGDARAGWRLPAAAPPAAPWITSNYLEFSITITNAHYAD